MATKRVSWELIVGDTALYFSTRKQAIQCARQEQGHLLELHRWSWVSHQESAPEITSTPVDLAALLMAEEVFVCPDCRKWRAKTRGISCDACLEQARCQYADVLSAPVPSLPTAVLRDIARALADE